MTRQEHLDWAKKRALEYLEQGNLLEAFTSLGSDLSKHRELDKMSHHIFYLGILHVKNEDSVSLRRWIEGFR